MLIGWPNRIDDCTLSGGSWTALPLTNLKDPQLTLVARSDDATTASTKFGLDLGQTRALRAFALVNHNLSQAATWRITLGSAAGLSDYYDSGWVNVWRMTFDNDMLEWESPAWWTGTADDEYIGAPFAAIHIPSTWQSARYCRIEIDDTANADGYVQIGRVFIGGGFEPTYSPGPDGASDAWEDLTVVDTTSSGVEYFAHERRFRVARFRLGYLSESEGQTLYEMQRRAGTSGEVLWIPTLTDAAEQQRSGFMGRLRQLNAIEWPYPRRRGLAFEIKEIV